MSVNALHVKECCNVALVMLCNYYVLYYHCLKGFLSRGGHHVDVVANDVLVTCCCVVIGEDGAHQFCVHVKYGMTPRGIEVSVYTSFIIHIQAPNIFTV